MTPKELAHSIIQILRSHSHQSYLVGGCVRDILLHKDPKDYDISTSATPGQVTALFPQAQLVGAHFGVVIVTEGGAQVEVATFRSDHQYSDGRRPSHVHFETDPRQDVLRRDFTINGLMLDPETGEVLDFVEGRHDVEAGIVRAIGSPEERFREDHLRMLRAVRFAARLGFELEQETFAAIVRLHPLVHMISVERVRDEIVRILTEGGARRGFAMLDQTQLLRELLPEVAAMKGVEQPPEFHPEGDVWTHTMIMLEGLDHPGATLALGVLLHDLGKPPTFRRAERIRFDGHVEAGVQLAHDILTRLRFSNEQITEVEALVANHMKFMHVHQMKESTLKRFFRLPAFEDHLELHKLDCSSSHNMLDNYEYAKRKREEFGTEAIAPPRLVTGRDLIQAGYQPGPAFARVLEAVEDAQLDGRVRDKREALELAHGLIGGSLGGKPF